jgi:hypothetical protein
LRNSSILIKVGLFLLRAPFQNEAFSIAYRGRSTGMASIQAVVLLAQPLNTRI